MNKEEAVEKIRDHVMEIYKIACELGTEDYLSIYITSDFVSFNNEYFNGGKHENDGLGIEFHEFIKEEK